MGSPRDLGGGDSLLFAANPIPMWVFDTETLQFLAVNAAAVAKYGFSREEFLGMTIADIRPPEDVAALIADVRTPTGAGLRGPALWRHRCKDGTSLSVHVTAEDILFKDRRARLVVAQDLGEAQRHAAEVQEKHRFLQSILDGMPAVVFVKDLESRFTLVNETWERFTGVPRDEAIGKTAQDLFPADVADRIRRDDVEMFGANARTETEENVPGVGGPQTQLTSRFPLRDEEGRANGLVGLAVDISERKRSEEKLREYERVVEGLEEMIVVVDGSYRYLLANRAFLSHRGLERDEVIGRLVPEVLGKDVFEREVKAHLDASFEGKVVRYEMTYTYPEMGERDLAIAYFPIEGPPASIVSRASCMT